MEKEVEVEMSTGLAKRWILKAWFVRAMRPAESILNFIMNYSYIEVPEKDYYMGNNIWNCCICTAE